MFKLFCLIFLTFLLSETSIARIIESKKSGNWTAFSTWKNNQSPLEIDTVKINVGDTIFINSSNAVCSVLINEGVLFFNSSSNNLNVSRAHFKNGLISGRSLGTMSIDTITIQGNSIIDKCHLSAKQIIIEDTLTFTNKSGLKTFGQFINLGSVFNPSSEHIELTGPLVNRGTFLFFNGKISFRKKTEIRGRLNVYAMEIKDELLNHDTLTISASITGNGILKNHGLLTLGMTNSKFGIDSLDLTYPKNTLILNRTGNQSIPPLIKHKAYDIQLYGNGNYTIHEPITIHSLKGYGTSQLTIQKTILVNDVYFEDSTTCIVNTNLSLNNHSQFGHLFIGSGYHISMLQHDSLFVSGHFSGDLRGNPTVVYNGAIQQSINPINYNHLVYLNSGKDASKFHTHHMINHLDVISGQLKLGDAVVNQCTIGLSGEIQIGGHSPLFKDTVHINGKLIIRSHLADPTFNQLTIYESGAFINQSTADISINAGILNNGIFKGCVGTACDFHFSNDSFTLEGKDTIYIPRVKGKNLKNKGILSISKELRVDTLTNDKNGILLIQADTQNITGYWDLSAKNNTVIFNKKGNQNIPFCVQEAENLVFQNSGNKILTRNIQVNENLHIYPSAHLQCDSFQIMGSPAGTFTIDSLSRLTLGHNYSEKNIIFPSFFSTLILHDSSTVIYASKRNQTISSSPHYGNLILDDGAVDSCRKEISGDSLIINGRLNLAESSLQLIIDDKTVDVNGDWDGPGQLVLTSGHFLLAGDGNSTGKVREGTSLFVYDGTRKQRIKIMKYFNLIIDKNGIAHTKANIGELIVTHEAKVKKGTLEFSSEQSRINHLIIEDSVTFKSKYQDKYFCHITIAPTGTFLLNYDEEIYIEGNIRCNGNLIAKKGLIHFTDTLNAQSIHGDGIIQFHKTTIQKNEDTLRINCKSVLNDTLFLLSGTLEVNNIIELKHVGYISNETALSPLIGTGKIRLFKTIIGGSYSNIGGLGLSIQSKTPMGNTRIEREFKAYNLMGKEGINRVYNIEPEINYDLDVTLEFHFWESELNENNLSELIMYKSTDKGENWFSVGGSLNDNNQSFQCSGIRQFSKWTLGSNQITPLAVELVAFKGKRLDDNIQLDWEIYTEIQTKAYQINYSTDGILFDSLTTVEAEGKDHYSFLWPSAPNKLMYFELIEIEHPSIRHHLDTILVMDVYREPKAWFAGDQIRVTDFPVGTLNVYDLNGQLVLHNNTNAAHLKRGIYFIELLNEIGEWVYEEYKK